MKGTIRLFVGMMLMWAAVSLDESLSDLEFLLWAAALAIPGAVIGFSGARAMNLANQT